MKHPCEIIARQVLPAFRSLIAKGLIEEHGFTQTAAAEKIGTTQAAISYYLSSKRGERYVKQLENNPLVKSSVREIVNGLAAGTLSPADIIDKTCELCTSLRNLNQINTIH